MSLTSPLVRSLVRPLVTPLTGRVFASTEPSPGYVFVYHIDGRQLFHKDGRPVQVADSLANS